MTPKPWGESLYSREVPFSMESTAVCRLDSYLSLSTKSNSRWTKNFKVKHDTLCLIEKKARGMLQFTGTGKDSLNRTLEGRALRLTIFF